MSNITISYPLSPQRIKSEFRRMEETRKRTQESLRGIPHLAKVLEYSLSDRAAQMMKIDQNDLLHHWSMHPRDRLRSILLGWMEEMEGEGGLLVVDPSEGTDTAHEEAHIRYIREVFMLATSHAWEKAFLHLEQMRRELGSAILETLDLDSRYWLDVEVSV